MNKKTKFFNLSSICFAFFMAMMVAFASSTTSEAASLGKVTNVKQIFGGLDSGKNCVVVQYDYLSNAAGYALQISSDKVNWEFAEGSAYTTKNYFPIGDDTTLTAGSTYYVRIIPLYKTATGSLDYDDNDVASATIIEVVTAPAKLANTVQTNGTTTSVTAKWAAIPGATGYNVYVKKYGESSYTFNGTTNSTSYTVKTYNNKKLLSDTGYYVAVCPIKKSAAGFTAEADGTGYFCCTVPEKLKKVNGFWTVNSKNLTVSWASGLWVDGYELQFFNAKGKKIKTVTVNASSYSATRYYDFKKAPKNGSCSVRVRSFTKSSSNAKMYSDWSKKTYFLSQANIPKQKFNLSGGKLTLKWTKVTGAKKYVIYAGTSEKKMKKVATVNGKKTSYTLKKVGGSKISASKSYYVKVIPQAKLGGKTVSGDHGYYWRIYRRYY